MNSMQLNYVKEIQFLLTKHDCKLILVQAPLPPPLIANMGNYLEITRELKEWASKNGLVYLDYNLGYQWDANK